MNRRDSGASQNVTINKQCRSSSFISYTSARRFPEQYLWGCPLYKAVHLLPPLLPKGLQVYVVPLTVPLIYISGSQLYNTVPLSKIWGMSSKSLKCDVRLPLHSIPLYRTPTIRGLVQSMLYNLGIRRCMRTDKMLALSLPCLILDRSLSAMQSPLFGFSEEFLDMWTWCYSKSMKALQYLHTCVNTPVTKSGRRSIVETERVQSHGHCLQGGGFGFAIRLLRIVRDTLESKEQYCTRMVWMLLLGCWPQGM